MYSGERKGRRLAAACLLALAAGCSRPAEHSAANAPAEPPTQPLPPPPKTVEIPKPIPPLERHDVIAAVAAAAEAYSLGRPSPETARLAGRRFEIVLPFGCQGDLKTPEAPLRYSWEPDQRRLKITAKPEVWTKADWAHELVAAPETEAIEGFWLSRPWVTVAACPAPAPATAEAASPETIALAQVFAKGGSRLMRRNGRPYELIRKLREDETPPRVGYRLVLAGRMADVGDALIRCRSDGPDQRPTCLVQVEIDHVALRTADGEELADWTS